MTAGCVHPHLDVRDLLDILERHKEAQRLSRGNALIVGDILFHAAVPPAVEVPRKLPHIQRVRHLGVAFQIHPVDAHHDVVLRPRAGDRIGRQLKEITLRLIARREEFAMLVFRQADGVGSHTERVTAHKFHRLVIDRVSCVAVPNRIVLHRRADLRAAQIIDRHSYEAGSIFFTEADPVLAQLPGRAVCRRCHAERFFRFLRAKRDADSFVRNQRDIVRQKDAKRHSLALLGKAADRLFRVIG